MSEKKHNERIAKDPVDLSPDIYVIVGPQESGKTFYGNRITEVLNAREEGEISVARAAHGGGEKYRDGLSSAIEDLYSSETGARKVIIESTVPTSEYRSEILNCIREFQREDRPLHVQLVITNSKGPGFNLEPVDEPFNSFVDFTPPDPTE